MTAKDVEPIPGAPECALWPSLAERLPERVTPPPWDCRVAATVWLQRASADAPASLPAPLRSPPGASHRGQDGVRGEPPGPAYLTAGGFVAYADSPVGPYHEVFGGHVLRRGVAPRLHVAFMAVDSLASLAGGRRNWALPKTLGAFNGGTGGPIRAVGKGWWLATVVRPLGPAIPAAVTLTAAQVWPDGAVRIFRTAIRGRCRPARVEVDVDPGCSLAAWLLPGRHLAVQWVEARVVVPPPAPEGGG
jgi:hypothetical protein